MSNIPQACQNKLFNLKLKKKKTVKIMKRYLRQKCLHLSNDASSLWSQSVDDFCSTASSSVANGYKTDSMSEILHRKRQYVIDCIAKRQLVNCKIQLLGKVRKRFLSNKKSFQPKRNISWYSDLPSKISANDTLFFGWDTQAQNKAVLFELFSRAFRTIVQEYAVLTENTFTFKVSKALNMLVFPVNAIDFGEFNSLNFLFKIYGKQNYSFDDMVEEMMSPENLPSTDLGVLHDQVFKVFQRINYFDYNEPTGDMSDSLENALFVYRNELYPFLVCEYVLVRFMIKQMSTKTLESVKTVLHSGYEASDGTVVPNICQMFPGVFTVLFLVYFDAYNQTDSKGILRVLMDIQTSVTTGDLQRAANNMKYISNFLCEVVYNIENDIWTIANHYKQHMLTSMSFMKYNYIVGKTKDTFISVKDMPFITR